MGQKKEISNAIRQALLEHGRIYLPEIGEMMLLSEAAYLDRSIGEISPSRTTLVLTNRFISAESKESSLEKVSTYLGSTQSDARTVINKHAGNLIQDFGEQLNASGLEEYYDLDNSFGLPDLQIDRIPVVRKLPAASSVIYNANEQVVNDLSLMKLVSVFATVFILFGAMWWIWTQSLSPVMESNLLINSKVNVSPLKVKLDSPDSNAGEADIEIAALEPEVSIDNEEPASTDSVDDLTKEGKTVSTLPKPLETEYKSDSCTIIIGSFGDPGNTSRLRDDIKKMGYKIYEKRVNNLTRIGIIFSCDSSNTSDFQRFINKKFKVRSHLLQ